MSALVHIYIALQIIIALPIIVAFLTFKEDSDKMRERVTTFSWKSDNYREINKLKKQRRLRVITLPAEKNPTFR